MDINCEEGWRWQNEKNAVALLSIDGKEWGTGALINNTAEDKKLLFRIPKSRNTTTSDN